MAYLELTEEDRRNIVQIINSASVKGDSAEYLVQLKRKLIVPIPDKPKGEAK